MKKLLITGASGFIGGFLIDEALQRGYETWAGVRPQSNRERLQDPRIRFIHLPYDSPDNLTATLKDFAATHGAWNFIIHNAGITKTTRKSDFFRINTLHTAHLIDCLSRANCLPDKFILMSSLSAQFPDTAYGLSKREAEQVLRRQKRFPAIILRPTGVYGPGDKDYLLQFKAIQAGFNFAAGPHPQQLTFIYVKDLANIALDLLETREHIDAPIPVADGDIHSDADFARLIQTALGKKRVLRIPLPLPALRLACILSECIGKLLNKSMTLNADKYRLLRRRDWTCDLQPLRNAIRFNPQYPLQRGLQETIAWYRQRGWLK